MTNQRVNVTLAFFALAVAANTWSANTDADCQQAWYASEASNSCDLYREDGGPTVYEDGHPYCWVWWSCPPDDTTQPNVNSYINGPSWLIKTLRHCDGSVYPYPCSERDGT